MVRRYFERVYWVDIILNVLRSLIIAVAIIGATLTLMSGQIYCEPMAEPCRLRPRTGQHLCTYRSWLYAGIRHPADDQLRPRRSLHGGCLHRLFCGGLHGQTGMSRQQSDSVNSALVCRRGRHVHARGDPAGTGRLPALARRAASCAADHGHRRIILPAIYLPRLLWFRIPLLSPSAWAARHDPDRRCIHSHRADRRLRPGACA